MRTAASIIGLATWAAVEVLRATGFDVAAEPYLPFALGILGSIAVTVGVWDMPVQPQWRMWVGIFSSVAIISLLMWTYGSAAWMLREAFPIMSEGIVAAPLAGTWVALVFWRVWRAMRGARSEA